MEKKLTISTIISNISKKTVYFFTSTDSPIVNVWNSDSARPFSASDFLSRCGGSKY